MSEKESIQEELEVEDAHTSFEEEGGGDDDDGAHTDFPPPCADGRQEG